MERNTRQRSATPPHSTTPNQRQLDPSLSLALLRLGVADQVCFGAASVFLVPREALWNMLLLGVWVAKSARCRTHGYLFPSCILWWDSSVLPPFRTKNNISYLREHLSLSTLSNLRIGVTLRTVYVATAMLAIKVDMLHLIDFRRPDLMRFMNLFTFHQKATLINRTKHTQTLLHSQTATI